MRLKEKKTIKSITGFCIAVSLIFLGMATATANAATRYKGYTMCSVGSTAYLLDSSGTSKKTWKASGSIVNTPYLLPDGSMICGVSSCNSLGDGAYPGGRFQRINKDGSTIDWDYTSCLSTATYCYDIEPMPNGNILVPSEGNGVSIVSEIKPSGTSGGSVVWQCTLPDSLATISGTYINSVKYNPALDRIVIDMQSSAMRLVVIDHNVSGGKILFTYKVSSHAGGNNVLHGAIWSSKYYIGTDSIIPDADTVAMRINNILVVHNTGEIVEVNPVTKSLVKSVSYSFAGHEGSVQRLPNGNWLVAQGLQSKVIAELDSNGTSIKAFNAPGSILRAYKYGMKYAGLAALGLVANSVDKQTRVNTFTGKFTYNAAANCGNYTLPNSNGSQIDLHIFSLDGKLVYKASSHAATVFFNTEKLLSGVYYLNVKHGLEMFGTKLVKM